MIQWNLDGPDIFRAVAAIQITSIKCSYGIISANVKVIIDLMSAMTLVYVVCYNGCMQVAVFATASYRIS